MPFFRSAPDRDRNLPWPIHGLAYVALFMGPISAGLTGGLLAGCWGIIAGLLLGIGISLLNALLMDKFLEPLIARHQKHLYRGIAYAFVNIIAFAWAFALSGLAMCAPFLIFGNRFLLNVH